ncbi:YrhC family protein [Cytobacillus spongiae]|jgi:hypothetical protein|uniref:YrhC family protein n=1 Tax=Cytobacillus spongiae TaxID=2901381 RepID=UPI001F455642|nr:YrhC family protein [Cytobacillus spongiae]UII54964.1 YrhC family protein [Cytobacillus spongiae]
MKQQTKHLNDKMVDCKRFAIVLLAVGALFYLGSIIPSETDHTFEIYIKLTTSIVFLGSSIILFMKSKSIRKQLEKMEE